MSALSAIGDLPPILASIAEAAGQETALLIARVHGGTRVLVPRAPGRNWLTQLVGVDKARVIIDQLGASARVDMPIGPEGGFNGSRRELMRRYQELEAQGLSEETIARALSMTGRTVRRRRARRRRDEQPHEADLFS